MLTSCRASTNIDDISGEWQYEDTIYLKCTGSKEKEGNPVGWVKLDDNIYNFTAMFSQLAFFVFCSEDDVVETKYELKYPYFWEAYLKELSSGNIELKIFEDYTGTYSKNTSFILEKL